MALNVFEGARRVALLTAAVWCAGWLAHGFLSEPDPALRLAVTGPGKPPTRVEACGPFDASRYINAKLQDNATVQAEVCFTAHKSDDGRMLVPYQSKTVHIELPGKVIKEVPASLTRRQLLARLHDEGYDTSKLAVLLSKPPDEPFSEFTSGGTWLMGDAYSSEVRTYIDGAVANLVLGAELSKDAGTLRLRARLLRVWEAGQFLAGGLVVGWILVAAVGWVARGFLGIPRGQDRRVMTEAPQKEAA